MSGYQVFTAIATLVSFGIAIKLIFMERNHFLPNCRSHGHGTVLLVFWTLNCLANLLCLTSWSSPEWWWKLASRDNVIEFSLWVARLLFSVLILAVGFVAPGVIRVTVSEGEFLSQVEAGLSHSSSLWRQLKLLSPFLWPRKNALLQFYAFISLLFLAAGRGVNVLIPIYYKQIVNSLSMKASNSSSVSLSWSPAEAQLGSIAFRWDLILIYCLLRFLQGSGSSSAGLLNNLRSIVWMRIDQNSNRLLSVKLFSHLHALSLRWHLGRKTGEVLRSMDRGTTSINDVTDYFVFSIVPTMADIIIAVVYFITAFNVWFGVIAIVTMIIYVWITVKFSEWRSKYRKLMNKLDNERNARAVDSILNFETVKYYGAEEFETKRYDDATIEYQRGEWLANFTLSALNTVQNSVITIGLLIGSLLCAYLVVDDAGLTVGDFVLYGSYILQLYSPLASFGSDYRTIQKALIDMENMLDFLCLEPEVKDAPDASVIQVPRGKIEFENVSFYYEPSKPILKDITFTILPGQTFALVGPSGSGKSTILRLLFRFYDVHSGVIRVDNQDIAKVDQSSLRKCIGVVPQDTVLFNDTIRSNIRYGRGDATDEEVEDAARAADIHERILSFPSGYDTAVGERGLKLSGGEKQRVAIARTVLKHPRIMLLDEATSALDTQAERNIQASLSSICTDRTALVVAHRLSTIIGADQILVLQDGEIVERGTHQSLLDFNGLYADMWTKQLTAEEENTSDEHGLTIQ